MALSRRPTVLRTIPTSGTPLRIGFDGKALWVTMTRPDGVLLFSSKNGAAKGKLNIHTDPYGIVYDGQSMWITEFAADVVAKVTRTR